MISFLLFSQSDEKTPGVSVISTGKHTDGEKCSDDLKVPIELDPADTKEPYTFDDDVTTTKARQNGLSERHTQNGDVTANGNHTRVDKNVSIQL